MGELATKLGIIGGLWFLFATTLLTLYLGLMGLCIAIRNTKYWIKDRIFDHNMKKLINEETKHAVE